MQKSTPLILLIGLTVLAANMPVAVAQTPYTPTKKLRLYSEPNANTRILADQIDTLWVCNSVVQNGETFGKVRFKTTQNKAAAAQWGFAAVADLPQTKDAPTFAQTEIRLYLADSTNPKNEPLRPTVRLYGRNGSRPSSYALAQQNLLNTRTRGLRVGTKGYLSAKIRHWQPDPNKRYTIRAYLRKRTLLNWLLQPSRYQIDSTHETQLLADRETIRRRDSCIVWHEDRSNTPYRWSGGCKEGYANGAGRLQLDTNRTYTGQLAMGMMEGEATLRDNAWELRGTWHEGKLADLNEAHTVLYYQNAAPARDTTRQKMYPTRAPITRWYAERNKRLTGQRTESKAFRQNDVRFAYRDDAFQLVLPDNENPAYLTLRPADCLSVNTWQFKTYERVGILYGDAPFFVVRCKGHEKNAEPDARIYYWARENAWYWWGVTHSDGPYATFDAAVKAVCRCR